MSETNEKNKEASKCGKQNCGNILRNSLPQFEVFKVQVVIKEILHK